MNEKQLYEALIESQKQVIALQARLIALSGLSQPTVVLGHNQDNSGQCGAQTPFIIKYK